MECEITFKKKFEIREDQDPKDISRLYLETMGFETVNTVVLYDSNYGDEILCQCGHAYYRHFDTYDDMRAVGCKYCFGFKEGTAYRKQRDFPANADEMSFAELREYEGICSGFKRAS